ncbi:PP2C family protein-serine/threonine phosphatase [Actinoplanes sp. M2I2]|uniref:PP2C family protein-serine/threonine phosphatase n=1 Tax=Actinoplanes sp. M2I2 TaxID=1734444 RepID=UPI002021B193|nr:PP2C family protein-serine/threonine phosphatase [Actinoplanes sp. M2I2]
MDRATDLRWFEAIQDLLRGVHLWLPQDLAPSLAEVMARVGLHTRVWVVNYEQTALIPLRQPGAAPEPLPVDGSLAGRAFARVRSARAGDERRWWVPMVDGTDRLGVIEVVAEETADTAEPDFLRRCELVAGLIGHLAAAVEVRGDGLERARRSGSMSTNAELLWALLPPLTASFDRAVVSAFLQPCYDVGGDGFDYAVDDGIMSLAVLDGAGRGLEAGLTCAVALAAIRATRRAGGGLVDQARAVDRALTEQFHDSRFATGVLAELDLETGRLRYLNAGHPAPIVLRDGRAVGQLTGGRRLPLGLPDTDVEVAEEAFEPDDRLLLYTDGVTEARTAAGDRFGEARMIDLVERSAAAGLPAPETVRRLTHSVLEHQGGPPADDATLMLVQWSAAAALNTVPKAAQEDKDEDAE